MADFLSENYWNNRYLNQQIGWDLGEVSPPIKTYINQYDPRYGYGATEIWLR